MKTFLLFISLFITHFSNAGFREYALELQKGENYFIENKPDAALHIYLEVLKKYNYPYAREIIQAAYIASSVGNKTAFELLITEATKKGLSPAEYQSLINRWQFYNTEKFEKDIYSENRKAYLHQLNRNKMAEYAKLDKHKNKMYRELMPDKQDEYLQQMNLLRNQYLVLINEYGYVNDAETGRKFQSKLVNKMKKDNNQFFFASFKANSYLGDFYKEKAIRFDHRTNFAIWSSLDVGAWFLSHYIHSENVNLIDSTLFLAIENGVNELKVSPYLLINMLESTRLLENDFAFTYYSRVLLSIRMNEYERYNLPEEQKNAINTNRQKYGMRSLEQEESLLRTLYQLKTKTELSKVFTSEDLKEISFEKQIFLNYMV